jgi:Domain of unknown function (DUF4279)
MEVSSRRTPYDDTYPTCERTCATLRVYPGSVDPDLITARLGITPTQVNKKGASWRTARGHEHTRPLNAWFLASEGDVDSKDVRRHLDWLLARLGPVKDQLRELQSMPEMKMSIECVWWSAYGQGGPTLWPEQMQGMAELGLECGFDIAFFGEDDGE